MLFERFCYQGHEFGCIGRLRYEVIRAGAHRFNRIFDG